MSVGHSVCADGARKVVLAAAIFVSVLIPLTTNVPAVNARDVAPSEWMPDADNLALGGTASQSSTSGGNGASRAIDGNINGIGSNGSVAETTTDNEAWWQVDLGSVEFIDDIIVWNRWDHCCDDQLTNFYVFVSDVPFASTSVAATLAQPGVGAYFWEGRGDSANEFVIDRTGRYVRVQLTANNRLYLAEVEVGKMADFVLPPDEIDPVPVRTWGVDGFGDSLNNQNNAEVFAIEQIGNTIYAGGRFTEVTERRGQPAHDQPYLAAFDATTGDWFDWWRPELDGAVFALAASADGSRLYVGGEFRSVDGHAMTSGLAALDPATGLVDPTWRAGLTRKWSTGPAVVRNLTIANGYLYAGGSFTHATTAPDFKRTLVYSVMRASLTDGALDVSWRPVVSGGSVQGIAVSPNGTRVYLVGLFGAVNGTTDSNNVHAVSASDGSSIGGLQPFPFNSGQTHMLDVIAHGDKVFVAGANHHLQVLNAADFAPLHSYHTGPNGGGEYQDLELVGDRIYATCHCWNAVWYEGSVPVIPFPSGGSQATYLGQIDAVFAVSATTGEYVPTFPHESLGFQGSAGGWAIHGSPDDCLWLGGDMDSSSDPYLNSLVRLCPVQGPGDPAGPPLQQPTPDTTAPTVPSSVNALLGGNQTKVKLSWTASTDANHVASYVVRRNGVLVGLAAGTAYDYEEQPGTTATWTVAAVDPSGNESAPSAPSNPLTVPAVPGLLRTIVDADFVSPDGLDAADGFWYVDDTFGTSEPDYAHGGHASEVGVVRLGMGDDSDTVVGMSGSLRTTFQLDEPTEVTLRFDYRLETSRLRASRSDEYADVLLAVDGSYVGAGGNDYIERIGYAGDTGWRPFEVNLGVMAAGAHTIDLGGYQSVRNSGYWVGSWRFDDVLVVGAAPSVDVASPDAGAFVASMVTLSAGASDYVDSTEDLTVDMSPNGGTTWLPATYDPVSGLFEVDWDPSGAPSGWAAVVARATDTDGNTTTSEAVTILVNESAPSVSVASPQSGSINTGAVQVRVAATDAQDAAGALDVEITTDGGASWVSASWNGNAYVASWDTYAVSNGGHAISARATDSVGLIAVSAEVDVTVDNSYRALVADDGAFAAWRLDDTAGTDVADAIAPDTEAIYQGTPAFGRNPLIRGVGTSVFFDGRKDRIKVPDTTEINKGGPHEASAIELWFRTKNVEKRQVLYEQGGRSRGMNLYIGDGNVYFGAWHRRTSNSAAPPWENHAWLSAPISAKRTYHVVLVLDAAGDRVEAYVNGVSIGTVDGVGALSAHRDNIGIASVFRTTRMHDGWTNEKHRYRGRIDEVAIYGNALTDAAVARHYKAR